MVRRPGFSQSLAWQLGHFRGLWGTLLYHSWPHRLHLSCACIREILHYAAKLSSGKCTSATLCKLKRADCLIMLSKADYVAFGKFSTALEPKSSMAFLS